MRLSNCNTMVWISFLGLCLISPQVFAASSDPECSESTQRDESFNFDKDFSWKAIRDDDDELVSLTISGCGKSVTFDEFLLLPSGAELYESVLGDAYFASPVDFDAYMASTWYKSKSIFRRQPTSSGYRGNISKVVLHEPSRFVKASIKHDRFFQDVVNLRCGENACNFVGDNPAPADMMKTDKCALALQHYLRSILVEEGDIVGGVATPVDGDSKFKHGGFTFIYDYKHSQSILGNLNATVEFFDDVNSEIQ